MRCLWDFIAEYPSTSSQFVRRRLSSEVREDLTWWSEFLPTYNGVLFFDPRSRPTIQVYTDAYLQGLGSFYSFGHELFWDQTIPTLEQNKAFLAPIGSSAHVSVHELEALLVAFGIWACSWQQSKVITYTDNTTAFSGLTNLTLRGPGNKPLRKILLLAAQNDIVIEARWIKSEDNGLADALSRGNSALIADLYPH